MTSSSESTARWASCAQGRDGLLVSHWTLASWLGLKVITRLVGKLGSWYSTDALHRPQKCLPPTSSIRKALRRSKLSTANPPTWVARRRTDARTPRPRRETIDSVMAMLGLSCRREVEASLDSPRNELSLPCKQEVQNALSGFSHDLDAGEVPRIPEETGIVKHQRAIGASFVAAALVAVLARFVQRRRKGGGGSSKKKKSRPPSKKKAS